MAKTGRPRGKYRISDAQMKAAYESGMTLREIADKAWCAPATVWKRLHEAGTQMRPQGGRRAQ